MLLIALLAAAAPNLMIAQGITPEIEAVLDRRTRPNTRRSGPEKPAASPAPAIDSALEECAVLARRDSAAAEKKGQDWIARSDGPAARQCLGFALSAGGKWMEAATAFREGARLAGRDSATAARLQAQEGNAALLGGDPAAAKAALDAALAGGLPDGLEKGEAYLDRARTAVALKDEAGARADLDLALRFAADDPLAWLLSATLARRMNDLPLARRHIAEAVSRSGDDASVALEQGVIAALSNNDVEARAAFTRAQKLGAGTAVEASARAYLAQLDPGKAPEKRVEGR